MWQSVNTCKKNRAKKKGESGEGPSKSWWEITSARRDAAQSER